MKIEGYEEAMKAVEVHMSPRARQMARLEAYVDGTQYGGMPSFWDDEKPLHERAPCIVYSAAKNAITSNGDLVLGEGRFPAVSAREDDCEDDEDDDASAAGADPIDEIDAFLVQIQKTSRFRAASREVFAAAQGCGSAVGIFGVRALRPFVETQKARWCEPTLNADREVERLAIEYPYVETYRERGVWRARARMYRRVIDATTDVTMAPADITQMPGDIKWMPQTTIVHKLGFCPVVWYPFMRGCSAVGDFDGHAIHGELLDEIDALNYALSQRHRAARYSGDPQWTECGVEAGYNPSSPGRGPVVPGTAGGGKPSRDNPITGQYAEPPRSAGGKRKKGPGVIWQYDDPQTKVTLHALPAGALEALDADARDIRVKLMESLAVVLLDPEDLRGASQISGKSLQAIRRRQIERCGQYRDDLADGWIRPGLSMLLRIANVYASSATKLRVRGIDKVAKTLASYDVTEGGANGVAAA